MPNPRPTIQSVLTVSVLAAVLYIMIIHAGTHKIERHVGLFQIDVLVSERRGISHALPLAEFLGTLFREQIISLPDQASLRTFSPTYRELKAHGGFARMVVTVTFNRDEVIQSPESL